MSAETTYLELYDYRRANSDLYRKRHAALQAGRDPVRVCQEFRDGRDALFAQHPQSALNAEAKLQFTGLQYFPYDPGAVVNATLSSPADSSPLLVAANGTETMPLIRVATLHFRLLGSEAQLTLFWIDVYGGGLFLPVRDTTSPLQSYGGGRYLLDTVKGSDLFTLPVSDMGASHTLDFNYLYNPSCSYNDQWTCPLAPPENRLALPIHAGERKPR